MPTKIPASEGTGQMLDEFLTQGVTDGDARAELWSARRNSRSWQGCACGTSPISRPAKAACGPPR